MLLALLLLAAPNHKPTLMDDFLDLSSSEIPGLPDSLSARRALLTETRTNFLAGETETVSFELALFTRKDGSQVLALHTRGLDAECASDSEPHFLAKVEGAWEDVRDAVWPGIDRQAIAAQVTAKLGKSYLTPCPAEPSALLYKVRDGFIEASPVLLPALTQRMRWERESGHFVAEPLRMQKSEPRDHGAADAGALDAGAPDAG